MPDFQATIILACHNVEEFIGEAFDSIVAQSIFDELEIIPVDDGSTDATREIISRFAERHPDNVRPIYFDDASGGPGRPRNAGLDIATADIVIFMDPDDRIHEDGYTTLVKAMQRHGSDLVIATRYGVPPHGTAEQREWTDYLTPDEAINDESYAMRLDLLERRPFILKTAYRRSIIEQNDLRFVEGITTSEDEIFDMAVALLSKTITKIHDVVYLYTIARPGSVTSKIRLKIYEDLDAVFAGMHDALVDYFGQSITSYRLAGLLRSFYLPKLLLLEPDLTDEALEIIHAACDKYGFDRLLLTEHQSDRRIIELIEARQFPQLMLYFMNQRNSYASGLVRSKNKQLASLRRSLNRRSIRYANKAAKALGRAKELARLTLDGELTLLRTARRDEGGFEQSTTGQWLFMDRRDKGADNAEALYRFVRDEGIHDDIAFVIRTDCEDWRRLAQDGFNLIAYNSIEHWEALYRADYFFASHCDDPIIFPWLSYGASIKRPLYRLVFLQHGIIRSDLSGWLGTKRYHVFCSSARPEYGSLLNNIRYRLTPDTLKLTGLARHDLLGGQPEDYVLVCPTWRSFLHAVDDDEFIESEFFRNWSDVLNSPTLRATVASENVRLRLLLHSSLSQFSKHFASDDLVEVIDFDDIDSFASMVSGARAMLTDYSTVSFDILYLRRPVVYFTFPEAKAHSTNVGANLDLYQRVGWLVDNLGGVETAVASWVENAWQLDADRVAACDEFFAFDDRNNRRRIIAAATGRALDG